MSAFLVSKRHIDYLVAAGVNLGVIPQGDVNKVGEMFLTENLNSLAARYGDDTDHEPYRFGSFPATKQDPVQIIKAAHCLDYQSCEHGGWKTSAAKKLLDKIEKAAIKSLPASLRKEVPHRYEASRKTLAVFQSPEYNAAAWEVR